MVLEKSVRTGLYHTMKLGGLHLWDTKLCLSNLQDLCLRDTNFNRASAFYPTNPTLSGFYPISDFAQNFSDVTLITMANNVSYFTQVDDPFFFANTSRMLYAPQPVPFVISYYPATVLGCTEQYQICSPNNCTSLAGLYQVQDQVQNLKLEGVSAAIASVLLQAALRMQMNWAVELLDDEVLLAKSNLITENGISSPLPNNQWMFEVENIHNISLAILQRHVVDYVLPPPIDVDVGLPLTQFIVPFNSTDNKALCQKQLVRSSLYQSFNFGGVLILIFISLLLIALKFTIPSIVGRLQAYSGRALSKRLNWNQSNAFILQKAAFEARGVGPWHVKWGNIPVTEVTQNVDSVNIFQSHITDRDQITNRSTNSLSKPLLVESETESPRHQYSSSSPKDNKYHQDIQLKDIPSPSRYV